jgi:hypothetical protein
MPINCSVYKLEGLTWGVVLVSSPRGTVPCVTSSLNLSSSWVQSPAAVPDYTVSTLASFPIQRRGTSYFPTCDVYGPNPENVSFVQVTLLCYLNLLIIFMCDTCSLCPFCPSVFTTGFLSAFENKRFQTEELKIYSRIRIPKSLRSLIFPAVRELLIWV